MKPPLVSILIPAHNAEEWIGETIRSAMAQTWGRKEIIVVDDGSSDRTFALARRFESKSVLVITQKNLGASAARNKAFSLSKGDYIQWLDADDLLASDKIARQMEVPGPMRGGRTLLSASWGHFIYRARRARFIPTPLWCDLSPAEFLLRKLEQGQFMQTAVWLVSRELTNAAGPWNTTITLDDDGEYFCRVLLASDAIRFVPEARVYYRLAGTASLSYVGQSNQKLESLWRSMQLHIRYVRSLGDNERIRAACVSSLQRYLISFYPQRPDIIEEMHLIARDLGWQLETPRLPWKYSWIKPIAGLHSAKCAQLFLPHLKWSFIRCWDKLARRVEQRGVVKDLGYEI
jgi:glycosyltransferase involved in cell wall biosynthesis